MAAARAAAMVRWARPSIRWDWASVVGRWWLAGNEGAAGGLDGDGAGSSEGVVGVADGVQVDPQGDGDLAHGGHLLAGFQDAGADGAQDLVADLDVDGNAGWLDVEGIQHLYACMRTFIQWGRGGSASSGGAAAATFLYGGERSTFRTVVRRSYWHLAEAPTNWVADVMST